MWVSRHACGSVEGSAVRSRSSARTRSMGPRVSMSVALVDELLAASNPRRVQELTQAG